MDFKEPLDVDLNIKSRPLTQEEKREISEFICNYKRENEMPKSQLSTKRMPTPSQRKKVLA